MDDHDLLRYVDVGALGGLDNALTPHADALWPILFEPNPVEALKIRSMLEGYKRHTVVERALAHVDGELDFTVTRNPTCSSLLSPNFDFLNHYGISYHFAVQHTEKISTSRYDTLFHDGLVPAADAIKIDVQGFEYEVLLGFGSLLAGALAIKLETHFYPLYKSQHIFGEIVTLLAEFGFRLRHIDLDKMAHFANDLVEVDAYFTKDRRFIRGASARVRAKFDLLTQVWKLPAYNFELP